MTGDRALVRTAWCGVIAALIGGGGAIWGYLNAPQAFFVAWLAAFHFWLSMPLGALALLLIWDLTGGEWEVLARVPLRAMAATMPLFILLFLPVVAGMPELYAWSRPENAGLLHNRWYLNQTFFLSRAAAYFVIWNGLVAWRLLRPRPSGGGASPHWQWISGLGVMLLGYSASYAGIDWIMSTEPDWFSSIYGMVVGSGQFITSLSCALVVIAFTGRPPDPRRLAALATILLVVVIFWAYVSFCQWLIVWEENLRAEIGWYIERWRGAWGATIYALAGGQFLVPFLVLVWSPAKRRAGLVGAVGVLLLVTSLVQVWWLLLPPFHGNGFTWLAPAVALGMGGLWVLAALLALRFPSRRAMARRAPAEEAVHG